MIKLRIKNGEHETDVRLPITEEGLREKLAEINTGESRLASQSVFVSAVHHPNELSELNERYANLDELNYLAKRMESFDSLEYDQFLIGISKIERPAEKELINLTFNLDHFTLCRDVSDYGRIGRAYVLNTEGSVPTGDEADPKYAVIGKELIDRGLTEFTEKGLLIYDPEAELTEVYDGHTFPEYYYKNCNVSVAVRKAERTELIQLPEEELAIEKALVRLGAASEDECDITLDHNGLDAFSERFMRVIQDEGLYAANELIRQIDKEDLDWAKLAAVAEFTGAHRGEDIALIAKHLDDFVFAPYAMNEEDVGSHFVNNFSEYDLNPDMEVFFDYQGFGESIVERFDGRFVDDGFVCYTGDGSLDELLEQIDSEDEDMGMEEM